MMTHGRRALFGAIVGVAVLGLAGCGDDDDDGGGQAAAVNPQQACDALAGQSVGGAAISAATLVAATATTPEHCRVAGRLPTKLNFEIRLPSNWNGKLHFGGGGGFNGAIPGPDANALSKGFANVSSDSGHAGNPASTPLNSPVFDASWALNDPEALNNFAYLSTPTVMAAAREIVQRRYGQPATRAYFEGCSNGGREALMNAQRFPNLFDGIISRAPAYNFTGLVGGAFNRNQKAFAAPGGAFTAGKITALSTAVLAACDTVAADGVRDGVVSNLQACSFNPASLRCPGGADTGDTCLSDAQINAVNTWISDTSVAGGVVANRGWPLTGNESDPGAWPTWVTGAPPSAPPNASLQFQFQDQFIKYMLAKNPAINSLAYSPDANAGAVQGVSAVIDAANPNLSLFNARGGKLILWHGANDSAISVNGTTQYYQQAVAAAGGQANANQFMRYYVAPGVNHCAGGPGADRADLLAALDAWVTSNAAPADLTATRADAQGAATLARPLCVWPRYPRYNGSGDVNAVGSYTCTAP